MLARVRRWLHDVSGWNAEHRAAWAGLTDPGADGFTPFQQECEQRLSRVVASRGLSLLNRRLEADPLEPYQAPSRTSEGRNPGCMIVAEIAELGAKVWLSGDQTDISAPSKQLRLERWDTKTPEQHYEAVVSFVRSLPLVSRDDAAS